MESVTTFIWSAFGYILIAGTIILIHEFGHYWVARRLGVKVLRFSLGFGPVIWRRPSPNAGEWAISMFPLGGYVQMQSNAGGGTAPGSYEDAHWLSRVAIAAAGPGINLITAVFFAVLVLLVQPDLLKPVVAPKPGTLLANAGVQVDDQVVSIDGRTVQDWSDLTVQVMRSAAMQSSMRWTVLRQDVPAEVDVPAFPVSVMSQGISPDHGLTPAIVNQPPVVLSAERGLASDGVLRPGDRIVALNGAAVPNRSTLIAGLKGTAETPTRLEVERDGARIELQVTPGPSATMPGYGTLGIALRPIDFEGWTAPRRHGINTLVEAAVRSYDFTLASAWGMYRLISGELGIKAMSGPLHIAEVSGETVKNVHASREWAPLLMMMVTLSIGIACINLLPLPALDGGVIVMAACEGLMRRPFSRRAVSAFNTAGIGAILMLFGAALYADFVRYLE